MNSYDVSSGFDRLIAATAGRMVWQIRLEILRKSLAITTLTSLVLSGVLLWIGRAPLLPAVLVWGLGFIFGLGWCFTAGVAPARAAHEADHRLGLNDLLITAWSIQSSPGPDRPWQQTILALADRRCRDLKAPVFPKNDRAWKSVGLIAVLTVLLGFLPVDSRRDTSSSPLRLADSDSDLLSTQSMAVSPSSAAARPAGSETMDEPSNRSAMADAPALPDTAAQQTSPDDGTATSQTQQASQAGGLSRTAALPPQLLFSTADSTAAQANQSGLPAGGTVQAANGGKPVAMIEGGTRNDLPPSTAPWQSSSWPSAQRAAMLAVQTSRIDPIYQDLVRDYFQQP